MRSNYHNIRAIIDNVHNYSEMIHGITEYAKSLFRANVIIIKNSIETKLRIASKTDENIIKIYSSPVKTNLKVQGKLDDNNVYVKNSVLNNIFSSIKTNESVIKIFNSIYVYITKYLKSNNDIYVDNSFDYSLYENTDVEENIVEIKNSEIEPVNNLNVQSEENQVSIQNPDVNAAAWYFLTIGSISGTLGSLEAEPIGTLGRKKVV